MAKARKDLKGRALRKGETQRKGDGRYMYVYTDPFGNRKYIYAHSLKDLREKEDSLKKDQLDGLDAYAAGEATLNFVFDRYISMKYNLRSTTRSNYIYMYNHFVRDKIGKRKIAEIKYSDIKYFYLYLITECGLQMDTVDNINKTLHPTFELAFKDDIIRKNPTDGIWTEIKKSCGKNKNVRHALTLEQQRAFLNYIKNHSTFGKWTTIFTVFLGTGCRVGEIIGLRWKDIDMKEKTININHSVVYYPKIEGAIRKCVYHVSLPKTDTGIRIIPMMDEVLEAFQKEYDFQKEAGFNSTVIDGMSGFIFSNKKGSIHNPRAINDTIKRIIRKYNKEEVINAEREHRPPVILPDFSCHHFRHTFCTRLCENETNLKVIQSIMGHSDIKTTMDIYAEVTEKKKKESIGELSKKYSLF